MMRIKFVFVFLLCLCMPATVFCQTKVRSKEFLYAADSKEEILAWGKKQDVWGKQKGGYCQVFEYNHGENHAIVLLEDVGSGFSRTNIYIYGKSKEMKEWHFVLYRPTGVGVNVHQEKDKLIFKIKTENGTVLDDVILEQPFDALGSLREKIDERIRAKEEAAPKP